MSANEDKLTLKNCLFWPISASIQFCQLLDFRNICKKQDLSQEPVLKKPQDSPFGQQRLDGWSPVVTPFWIIIALAIFGVVFLPLGVIITIAANGVVELPVRYDDKCGPANITGSSYCTVNMTVTEEMRSPLFFYYGLSGFYQNNRRYLKSRSDEQLQGTPSSTINCEPISSNSAGVAIYPCGLIANSYFNDTFSAKLCVGNSCGAWSAVNNTWVKEGIAWPTDVEKKFVWKNASQNGATDVSVSGFVFPRIDDEDFIVWMRTAGLPYFRKLYRRIKADVTLNKGDVITVTIRNTYPVDKFSGEKWIVLSESSWIGGKNRFLGWAYIVVGVICVLLAIIFALIQAFAPRTLGDLNYFHWESQVTHQTEKI